MKLIFLIYCPLVLGPAASEYQGFIGKRNRWTEDGSTIMWCIGIDPASNVCQFFQSGAYAGGCVVLPADECKSIELSRTATDSKEEVL